MNTVEISKLHSVNNIREVVKNEEYQQLKNNIEMVSMTNAITVTENEDGSFTIVDGHQRFEILKDLGKTEANINVIPSMNGSTQIAQLSANTFRVNMSLFDEVMVLKNLADSGSYNTQQEIADTFGKSNQWVTHRMQYANLCKELLIPELLNSTVYDYSEKEDLKTIAKYDISKQEKAVDEYKETFELSEEEWLEDIKQGEFNLYKIKRDLNNSGVDLNIFNKDNKVFTKKELDGYAFEYGAKPKSLTLFGAEYDTNSKEIVNFAMEDKYSEIVDELGTLSVEERWNSDATTISFIKLISYKDPIKQINRMESWNGDLFNIRVTYKAKDVKSTDNDTIVDEIATETDPYQNSYRKLAKVVSPFIWDAVKSIEDRGQQSFKWYAKNCTSLANIDCWNNPLANDAIDNSATFDELGNQLVELSFQDSLQHATISTLDSFLKLHKNRNIRTIVKELFEDTDNFMDFRVDTLKCFTIGSLQEKYPNVEGKTKSELVNNIAESDAKWKFTDFFKEAKSNFWNELAYPHRNLEDDIAEFTETLAA
jgi:hypothetical protein